MVQVFRAMKSVAAGVGLVAVVATGAHAQDNNAGNNENSTATRVSGWVAQCASQSRAAVLTCNVERGLYLAESGQQFAKLSVRVPGNTKKPEIVIQLPHGMHLPSGVMLQFDDNKAETQQVHTCDANGCYVLLKDATRMVVSMKGGTNLKLSFKNLTLDAIEAVLPLDGFTAAYASAE